MTRPLVLVLALGCAPVLAACGTVKPYERGRLLTRVMRSKPAPDVAFDTHVAELRESAIGATSGENASCGCR